MSKELEMRIEELAGQNRRLAAQLEARDRVLNRALESYQQSVLETEVIQRQKEDLERLAEELAKAKCAEEERTREFDEATRLKSDFITNLSRKIRTPLDGITEHCELIIRDDGSRLTPNARRNLGMIKINTNTLLSLLSDILELAKGEPSFVAVVREHVDIQTLLDECAAATLELLRGKDVTVGASVSERARRSFTDPVRVRQIVRELLSNAVKFTTSGEILVEADAVDDELVVFVEDTGIGIPSDQLPSILEKLRLVDDSSSRTGLAIVAELARELGGSVSVTSAIGGGTRFTVTIASPRNKIETIPATPENVNQATVRDSGQDAHV